MKKTLTIKITEIKFDKVYIFFYLYIVCILTIEKKRDQTRKINPAGLEKRFRT